MARSTRLGALAAVALALLLPALAASSARSAGTTIRVAFNKKLKRTIVVAAKGRSLYMYTADTSGSSNCTDADCKALWPPLLTTSAPIAGKGIRAALLGTTKRPDGKLQVTYNKHPLYFFRGGGGYGPGDRRAGQLRGQGLFSVWWVLTPKGTPIKKKPR